MNPLPQHWKEARRLHAWTLHQKGWAHRQIAEALSVSEGTVSQWLKRAREGGPETLYHRPPPGAVCRWSADPLARLPALWHRGADADGFRGQVWTRGRIAAVLSLECGVSSHPVHVGRLGNARQWSLQKPARRARQRAEAAMARWRQDPWPAIHRGRQRRGSASVS